MMLAYGTLLFDIICRGWTLLVLMILIERSQEA